MWGYVALYTRRKNKIYEVSLDNDQNIYSEFLKTAEGLNFI